MTRVLNSSNCFIVLTYRQFERDASIARAAARERVVQPHGNININQYYQKVNISREAEEASDEVNISDFFSF